MNTRGRLHVNNSLDFDAVWTNSFAVDDVNQKLDSLNVEFALVRIQSHSFRLKTFQNQTESVIMLLLRAGINKNVVHVAYNTFETVRKLRHLLLEKFWSR